MAETREDVEFETAILTRDRTRAEIAKLEAETRSLDEPKRGFIERNWVALLASIAGLVAAFGGIAALLTAIVQVYQLPYTEPQELLDAHKSAVDAITMEAAANKSYIDAQKQVTQAKADLKKMMAEQQQLAAEKKQTLRELVAASGVLSQYQSASAKETLAARGAEEKLAQLAKSGGTAEAGDAALKILAGFTAQPAAQTKGQSVDIQYADRDSLEKIDAIGARLARDGYAPSDPELLKPDAFGKYPDEVRYFGGPETQRAAQALADRVNAYFGSLCPGHPHVIASWHFPNADAPPSLLELWIKFPCRPAEKLRHSEGAGSGRGA